jgi:hypothetical protein
MVNTMALISYMSSKLNLGLYCRLSVTCSKAYGDLTLPSNQTTTLFMLKYNFLRSKVRVLLQVDTYALIYQ